jgi:hypothetical protein
MSSKRLFASWSKRQSGAEPYYRTGGLLPIDMMDVDASASDSSNNLEPKVRVHSCRGCKCAGCAGRPSTWLHPTGATPAPPKACAGDLQPIFGLFACTHLLTCQQHHPDSKRRRPMNLTIVPPDSDQFVHNPLSSPPNVALASSSSNLFAIFNDMLRSPASGATAYPQSASVHKPSPARPRSLSLPSSPGPIELPGSILQDNQGYPENHTAAHSTTNHPVSYTIQPEAHPSDTHVEDDHDPTYLLELLPRPLNHAKSVPSLVSQYSTMRSAPGGGRAASAGTATMPNPMKARHRESLGDLNQQATGRLLHPSSTVNESKSRTSAVSERTGRRDDVSVAVCFHNPRCLLVEMSPHEETVSHSFVPGLFSPFGTLSA